MAWTCAKNFCRMTTIFFELIGLLAGLIMIALGSYYYNDWQKAGLPYTQVPVFIAILIFFGILVTIANTIGCIGSCRKSRAALLIYVILTCLTCLAQALFVIVLFANPKLVAQYLNTNQVQQLDNMLSNPREGAGIIIALVVGFQIAAVIDIYIFRTMVTGTEAEEEEYWDKVTREKMVKRKEAAMEKAKMDFELSARRKVAENDKKEEKKAKKGKGVGSLLK